MKKSTLLKFASLLGAIAVPSVRAQTVNFHDALNGQGTGYATSGAFGLLYYGQGAYKDTGNNIWNGFSKSSGPGGGAFYGPGLPDNPQQPGNPGNPYAAWGTGYSTGTDLFSPANDSAPAGNATSAGTLSPVTLFILYGGSDNGLGNVGVRNLQGQPAFLLSESALANGSDPTGTFQLANVPAGTYTLYLYGANFDNNRGALFTVDSGAAVNGITGATNNPAHASKNFILGENFVVFTNVVPASGVINGTWSPVVNPFSNLSGEGNFCGMQLVTGNHPPVAPTLAVSAPPAQLVTWAPVSGILQSAPSPTGPWTDIPGATSPYVGSGALSYRVLGN